MILVNANFPWQGNLPGLVVFVVRAGVFTAYTRFMRAMAGVK